MAGPAVDTTTDLRVVESIEELLSCLDLTAVRFIELRAELASSPRPSDTEAQFELGVAWNHSTNALAGSFRMTSTDQAADYVVAVRTLYTLTEPLTPLTPALAAEFIERIAVMAAFPFLRQGLASLATMLGAPVTILGFLRAGDFRIDPDQLAMAAEAPEPSRSSE